MMFQFAAVVCVLHVFYSAQLSSQALVLDMMPDAFDDQYINCEDRMEREMPKILAEERKYGQFDVMWKKATNKWWNKKMYLFKRLNLPASFRDEYGVAVVLYTLEHPYPIYRQLNGDITIAGRSRDYYMNHFHFKAFHFYLTRALQMLRKSCPDRVNTYRGTALAYTPASYLRFGQFASSSRQNSVAQQFGTGSLFSISTYFGVDINFFSDFDEDEVLIPVSEKFSRGWFSSHDLSSTGQLCSYFNCAYFGGEKRETPVCNYKICHDELKK